MTQSLIYSKLFGRGLCPKFEPLGEGVPTIPIVVYAQILILQYVRAALFY